MGATEFVSPGPSASTLDPSISNAIHPVGSKFHIAWSGTNLTRHMSVVLFQYNETSGGLVYPFEDATPSMLGAESFDWTVATDKNLSASTLFLFNIFYEGDTSPSAVSETFRITDDSTTSSSTTTTSSSTTFATSASLTGSTTSTISTTPISAASTMTSAVDTTGAVTSQTSLSSAEKNADTDGLSMGAKVGLGVAIPAVALLGIAAGYCFFRHRAGKQKKHHVDKLVTQVEPQMYQEPPNPPPYYRYEMDVVNPPTTHELYGDFTGR
ncbi:hypothetical protein PFICI_13329 [Pestalotiopsis fici W106-1]|uniref:Mid2 domain-containing protein n=1 Tax=Pestalotiopsis fici (strain W106-1 / CGMCC3.15140) TaxID=1229662 RepID=W3WLQ5_PESFW|nr:uncharacterized protein PFICI_13329 [Pestalotiopsis fici W106-1]ETS74845.1 hypothetical protein PFICI_13329 [Pestalotiopsis fici W106-1]